jgi:Peptidase family S41
MRPIFVLAFLGLSSVTVNIVGAQSTLEQTAPPPAPVAQAWRTLTQADVEAAYGLIKNNHPAAAPEVGDDAFRERLERAHTLAVSRAERVTSYEGYIATLRALMTALGDPHLAAHPALSITNLDWAGLIVSKRSDKWIVTDEDAPPEGSLLGAQVVSCDGRVIDDIARESLGEFRALWSVEAQQVIAAPWLFVSERNPFVTRPTRCEFLLNGQRREHTLVWRKSDRESLRPRLNKAMGGGAAGYGVRRVGEGYWIALEGLEEQASPVVAAVRNEANTMRSAKFIVLDMRGNSGGSSLYGKDIAVALLGKAYVERILGPLDVAAHNPCDDVIRATPDNLRQLEVYVSMLGPDISAEQRALADKVVADTKGALAEGREFAAAADCRKQWVATASKSERERTAKQRKPKPPIPAKLFVLTDHWCFSSCLVTTEDFRRLGAVHVGSSTNSNARYLTVRDAPLPSGLAIASTMTGVSTGPVQFGPFVPAFKYDGDIADTAALERWITQLASQ